MLITFTTALEAETIVVSTKEELSSACGRINANGGEYTISLQDDIADASVTINHKDAVVTLASNGHTLSGTTTIANISGGILHLGDEITELTLKSDSLYHKDPGIIYITGKGVCHMWKNVTTKDRKLSNYLGGGASVRGGTFYMHGGIIENSGCDASSTCFGGGVAAYEGGTFIMNGGEIKDCYITTQHEYNNGVQITGADGGVFVGWGSSFEMDGGTIKNCRAKYGAGIAMVISWPEISRRNAYGYTENLVRINGGNIIDNTATKYGGGIFASGYHYTYHNAIVTPTSGAAMNTEAGLYINNGTISGNNANAGGGAYLMVLRESYKQHVQINNAAITNNTAAEGAGLEVNSGFSDEKVDIENCTITGNVSDTKGGGIFLTGDGTISRFLQTTADRTEYTKNQFQQRHRCC